MTVSAGLDTVDQHGTPHASNPANPLIFQPKGSGADAAVRTVDPAGRDWRPPGRRPIQPGRVRVRGPGSGAEGEVEPCPLHPHA